MPWFSFLQFLFSVGVKLVDRLTGLSDEELVKLAQGQDEDGKRAFAVLIARHQGWLLRLLQSLVNHRQDAEELVQNTMVRAFFALPRFRGDASFKTWLRTIASREAFNHYRRSARRADAPTSTGELVEFRVADAPAPEVEQRAALEHLERALTRVPYPYREILVMRYVEELSLDEIGAALELGKSATKMRLMRAREFFKDAYGRLDEEVAL